MLMKVCPTCKGDGFWRVRKEDAYPEMNVAGARLIRKPMAASQHGSLHDYYVSITGYEFDCRTCQKTGEIQWNRGKSLTPLK